MKKFFLGACVLALSSLAIGCSQSQKADEQGADSTKVEVDSTAIAEPVVEEPVVVNPTEVLTLTPGKKKLSYGEESSVLKGSWPMEVTNNGTVAVEGDAYCISYSETMEITTPDGCLDEKTVTKKEKGVTVQPGETVTITLRPSNSCTGMSNPKLVAAEAEK